VEDEAKLAGRLAASLGQAGYAVDCAANGERAQILGHDEEYDAVVLDLGLPRMDGLTVLRQWREAGLTVAGPHTDSARNLARKGHGN